MIVTVPRQGYTEDMLQGGSLPWPQKLPMTIGNGIDLQMHGGRLRGTLAITSKHDEMGWWRAKWMCPGSALNNREFLIKEGGHSELAARADQGMVISPYRLAPV
jgi:hypothetical protein